MGLVGRYIDSRNDEAKDRIITGQLWGVDFCDDNGHRCLCGHAEDWDENHSRTDYSARPQRHFSWRSHYQIKDDVFNVVPRLFKRFGQDRIVAMFKTRAAKDNTIPINQSKPEYENQNNL